jgi:hypothetical protein
MITLNGQKVKIIKSRTLKNGVVGAYVRYPDKKVKWRIIGKSKKGGGGDDFLLHGLTYKSNNEKLKALGINKNKYKLKAKNISNLLSNNVNSMNDYDISGNKIHDPDKKKYEFTKTQADSFSNNQLFGMQYFCEAVPKCAKFRSSVKSKYPARDYRSNARDYDAKLMNINSRTYKLNYKNIKNLIANKNNIT